MRTVLIGARGQLGTELRALLPPDTLALDLPEFDVQREAEVRAALQAHGAELVINCAAQTNVDLCENEPEAAFAINALGARTVARCAAELGAAVIYISTDYVFGADTERSAAYAEHDVPGPINVYGASKWAGEALTLACNRQALVVRTCGLYGRAGARGKGGNFVETMLRLAGAGQPVRVVNDQRVSPTAAAELAVRLCALVAKRVDGVYHVAAPDSCTWFEFAQAIFAHEKVDADLRPVNSAEYPVRARRPAFSALCTLRLERAGVPPCRPWREMLDEYLCQRAVPAWTGEEQPT